MSLPGRALALAGLSALLAGCAPKLHTIERYRRDAATARALETDARDGCAHGSPQPRTPPARPFVTDGCSLWIDGGWGDPCCVEHDARYWCGGESRERLEADADLRRCVSQLAPAGLAWLMWLGVRIGGHPIFPTHYRWGYGRDYWPFYDDYRACGENAAEESRRPDPGQATD